MNLIYNNVTKKSKFVFISYQFDNSKYNKVSLTMGPKNSKQTQASFMQDYQIIQTNNVENITYLQHKKTLDDYLLKQFNFNDKKQCQKMMQKLAELKTKLAGNKHVTPLKDYLMHAQDQYCSTFYKIYALFQYPQRTLDDQINERKLQRKRFSQTELWSILASCIVGLSHLQKNGIKHLALKSSNILLSKQGLIKISDPYPVGQATNYDTALTKRSSTLHSYLSPEQCMALQQQTISPVINPYKSDIFTLGMIMLQASLLQYQDQQCYRDQKSRIHWQTVQYNIDRLGHIYSLEIRNMVEFMLSRDQRARPDWIDLEEHVMKGGSGDEVRRSFIQQQIKENHNNSFNSFGSNSASNNQANNPRQNSANINANRNTFLSQDNSSQPISLHAHKGRNSAVNVTSNLVTPSTLNVQPTINNNKNQFLFDKTPKNQYISSSTTVNNISNPLNNSIGIGAVGNTTFGRYSRPQSPRVGQGVSNNNTIYNNQYSSNTLTFNSNNKIQAYNKLPPPIITPSSTIVNSTTYPPTSITNFGHPPLSNVGMPNQNIIPNINGVTNNNSLSSIQPIRVSNIEHTRPTKNVFPSDTYVNKTKFDQNLIIMTEDDYDETEDNDIQNSNTYQQQNNNAQIPHQYMQNYNQGYQQQQYIVNGMKNRVNKPQNQYYQVDPIQARVQQSQVPTQFRGGQVVVNNVSIGNVQGQVRQPQQPNSNNYPPSGLANYPTTTFVQQPASTLPAQRHPNAAIINNNNNVNNNNNPRNVENGQLKFVTEQFKLGSSYQGYKLNGLRHGYGKFYYQDGGMYDGDWQFNKMEGLGKLYYQSGQLAYEGMWMNDQFMGKGVLYNQSPDQLNNPYNYNNFDDIDQYWTKYQGEFLDDMKNGKGILYLSNGEKFQGNFVNDCVQGPGTFYTINGQKITGNWAGNAKIN